MGNLTIINFTATDASGNSASCQTSVRILSLLSTTVQLPNATLNQTYEMSTPAGIVISGQLGRVVFSADRSLVPDGLIPEITSSLFDGAAQSLRLIGVPTKAGAFSITVQGTDAGGEGVQARVNPGGSPFKVFVNDCDNRSCQNGGVCVDRAPRDGQFAISLSSPTNS